MTRTDGIIIALSALLVGGLYTVLWTPGGSAATAVVWVDGRTTARLPLADERELRVDGPAGTSVIQVAGGRARVAASPGARQLCVRAGWLTAPGESAVCLPNRVILSLEGPGAGFDAINF